MSITKHFTLHLHDSTNNVGHSTFNMTEPDPNPSRHASITWSNSKFRSQSVTITVTCICYNN